PPRSYSMGRKDRLHMRRPARWTLTVAVALALFTAIPTDGAAAPSMVPNPICVGEDVLYNPGNGEDIVVPSGYRGSVFAKNLNFPTAVAFRGNKGSFEVFVLESGHGLPSICNNEESPLVGGVTSPTNPFTPDILVFDKNGTQIRGPLAKPSSGMESLQ